VTEITHDISGYHVEKWFEVNGLDHATETVVRREIHADGRSRAFINDTPVNNKTLKELGELLVDIHSQHQSLLLGQPGYQVEVLDRFRGNRPLLEEYRERHEHYRGLLRELEACKRKIEENAREEEFTRFQFNRLDAARLRPGEQRELEEELSLLSHAETIKGTFGELVDVLTGEERPVVQALRSAGNRLDAIAGVIGEAREYGERLQSVIIELQDIADEASRRAEEIEYSPNRVCATRERLDELYDLLHKYKARDVDELIRVKDDLDRQLREIESSEYRVEELSSRVRQAEQELEEVAARLHRERVAGAAPLEEETHALLVELGMRHARFSVVVEPSMEFTDTGKDAVTFLFSANKNHAPGELSRVASGGETSRLMLSMKYILSRAKRLPAIIFDEIDTGVSGEIAHRVATMLRRMSERVQVICISHLPQVAAAADVHFKVYKEEGQRTLSRVKRLSREERIAEIAGMISGSTISSAAIENARQLLENRG
jgi:DNA repair protein RecN (Recombination protein N)